MKGSGKEFPFFRGKIKLKQPETHRVSVDLVIFLSKVRGIRRSSKVVDLGAGFGFLSIALAKKFGCEITAVERDEGMFSLLLENIERNEVKDRVRPLRGDIRSIESLLSRGSFDVVVTNPPFYPEEYGKEDGGFHFESDTTLRDFIRASSYILRDGGYLNLLLPSFRLYELFSLFKEFNLPPRFLDLMYPNVKKRARLAIVTSIKNVPGPLEVGKAIFINKPEGGYTQEVSAILEGFL